MKNKLLLTAFAILALFAFNSCKQKGCMDKNSDTYDQDAEKDDGSCTYRYSSGITISVPVTNWDPFDGPDLYVKFAKTSSSTWDYTSSTGSDAYSCSLTVPSAMFTNESWDYEIYDYDTLDPDDLVASGSFNPLTSGSGGNITLTGSGITLTFQYILKN